MGAGFLLSLLLAASPAEQVWAPVLQAAGLTADQARVDLDRMELYGGGRYRLPLYDVLMRDPLNAPELADLLGRGLLQGVPRLADALSRAGQLADLSIRRGLVGNRAAYYRGKVSSLHPLQDALDHVRAAGPVLPGTPYDDSAVASVPMPLQQELATLLLCCADAATWREIAFEETSAAGIQAHVEDLLRFATLTDEDEAGTESLAHERRLDRLVSALDLSSLVVAATDLALVLDDVVPKLAQLDWSQVQKFQLATPFGPVVVGSAGADSYQGPPPLVAIDPGGDDTWATGAGAAAEDRPVSILIDLAGNDRYQATVPGSLGCGVGGVGILLDLAGDDTYQAGDASLGCGIGGVGLLWDGQGDDTYAGRVHTEGAGAFGVGALVDAGGNDRYTCLQRGQGYGYTLGAGALLDAAGDDIYLADDEHLDVPSPQDAQHNASLSQGFGFGRRADYTTGHGLCGGVGWLADGGGSDTYSCGVFGQGGGYWYGVGWLTDLDGNDRYHGIWYVQGAAAHFAFGGLLDEAGDDQYEATRNMALGAGHDFSLGSLTDLAGNDRYVAPNLSLGAGNANGVGLFREAGGNDTYEAVSGVNLGRARTADPKALTGSPRKLIWTLGLFLDESGRDDYPRDDVGDGKTWTAQQDGTAARGVGVDR